MKLLAKVENLCTIITYYQIIAAEIIIKWEGGWGFIVMPDGNTYNMKINDELLTEKVHNKY